MPAKPLKSEGATPVSDVFLVTEAAIGPVTRTTPFDREVIQKRFGDADVKLEHADHPAPMITVEWPGWRRVMLFGKDGLVVGGFAWGKGVQGPNGETMGASMSELGVDRAACSRGIHSLQCRRPGVDGLIFTFAEALAGQSGEEPYLEGIGWAP